jgi:hypothetical protein
VSQNPEVDVEQVGGTIEMRLNRPIGLDVTQTFISG